MKKLLPALFVLFLLTGCNSIFNRSSTMSGSYYEGAPSDAMMDYDYAEAESSMMSSKSLMMDSYDSTTTDRKLIKTADMGLHVADVRATTESVATVASEQGGDVTYSSVSRGSNSYYASMTVKVPSDHFDSTITALKALADYVEYENTNANDVTEYYADLDARLTNKQAEEQQYLKILEQATTVEDTLAVTSALSNVRYEIESLQGQLKSYDSQIDYSTISLSLTEDESAAAVSEKWSPNSTVNSAFSDFVAFGQGAVDAVIYAAIFAWPLVVILVIVWIWRKSKKNSKK